MFLTNRNCHNALPHVDETCFFSRLESSAPSSEVAAFGYGRGLLSAGAQWWFMYFGVAAIDLKFLDSCSFFKLTYIKCLHRNDYIIRAGNGRRIDGLKYKVSLKLRNFLQKLQIPNSIQIFLVVHVEPTLIFHAAEVVRNLGLARRNLTVGLGRRHPHRLLSALWQETVLLILFEIWYFLAPGLRTR